MYISHIRIICRCMNAERVRPFKEPNKSFIYYKEDRPFIPWHQHPEYELSLITKGKGIRMVGDRATRFENNDLVLIGAYTPHETVFDPEYKDHPSGFQGEGIFIQFVYDFLGEAFFKVPENHSLDNFLKESNRGYVFLGETKKKIISILKKMEDMSDCERIYSLLSIFRIFSTTKDFKTISSSNFNKPFWIDESGPMQKASQYILQNFHKPIFVKDLLEITNMSNTSFYAKFKKTFRMPFKDYLLKIRIGYACKLISEGTYGISGVAYKSGFENISNFNRQFKKIKGITPSSFQENAGNNDKQRLGAMKTA